MNEQSKCLLVSEDAGLSEHQVSRCCVRSLFSGWSGTDRRRRGPEDTAASPPRSGRTLDNMSTVCRCLSLSPDQATMPHIYHTCLGRFFTDLFRIVHGAGTQTSPSPRHQKGLTHSMLFILQAQSARLSYCQSYLKTQEPGARSVERAWSRLAPVAEQQVAESKSPGPLMS